MMKDFRLYLVACLLAFGTGCSDDSKNASSDSNGNAAVPSLPTVPPADSLHQKSSSRTHRTQARTGSAQQLSDRWRSVEREIRNSPFSVKVQNIYLSGECAKGPVPEKRRGTRGIKVVVQGEMAYNGSDLLLEASVTGALVVTINGSHVEEVPFQYKSAEGRHAATGFLRLARGADPWVKGQTRSFVIESMPMSEGFCEFVPAEAKIYVTVKSMGVAGGLVEWPVSAAEVNFDEVVGMAIDQQVQVRGEKDMAPAAAHVARLDMMLITTLDGNTRWVSRKDVSSEALLEKMPGTLFPAEMTAGNWKIQLKGISSAKSFADVPAKGEDEFWSLVQVIFFNTSKEELSIEQVRLQLESAPNDWRKPVLISPAPNADAIVAPSDSLEQTLAFLRYRFERPTRLRVDVLGSGTGYLSAFSYDIGPERSPLRP